VIGIVLVAHGTLAPAVLRSIESVLGHPVPGMLAVGTQGDETLSTLRERVGAAITQVEQGQGTIILTDMFGDSATNVSLALAKEADLEIVTGVNVPLILKVISARQAMNLQELAAFVVEYGRAHILRAGSAAPVRPGHRSRTRTT